MQRAHQSETVISESASIHFFLAYLPVHIAQLVSEASYHSVC